MSERKSIKGMKNKSSYSIFAKELVEEDYPKLGEDNQPIWSDLDPNNFYLIRYLYDKKPGLQYKEVIIGIKSGKNVEAVPILLRNGPVTTDANPSTRQPRGKYLLRPIGFQLNDELDNSSILEFFKIYPSGEGLEDNYWILKNLFDKLETGNTNAKGRKRSNKKTHKKNKHNKKTHKKNKSRL
jgi:hypothetical protein